jgi:ribonuclease-3
VDRADALAGRLGLPIRDRRLLAQALTHRSWVHEHPDESTGHNERLEFLGDAVVNLVIAAALYARHPGDDEGLLSSRRAAIVNAAGLARLATRIGLGRYLALGEGEARPAGRRRPSILASAFEALVGAAFLDLGWESTEQWLIEVARPEIDASLPPSALKSPKSRLQELLQQTEGIRPTYRIVEAAGPDHERIFRIEALFGDEVLGVGVGPSRRAAETAAAAEALAILELRRARAAGPA